MAHGNGHSQHGDGGHGGGHGHGPVLNPVFGVIGEFSDPEVLLRAAEKARSAGYKRMDAYTPFPVHGLAEAIGFDDWRVPWAVFVGGLGGAAAGWLLQYFTAVVDYPWNVGGKPLLSWPMMIPITFECTILLSAFTAVGVMLALNGLPRPYQSIFNAKNFERASQDRFFLCIESEDPKFEPNDTAAFLLSVGAEEVSEVER